MSDAASARALVLEAPCRFTTRSLPLPEIGDDDALLRVEACGLCGTDHEEYTGELFPGYAFVPGHETIGILEAVGPTAAARWGVRTGDRVAVEVFLSCGKCDPVPRRRVPAMRAHGLGDMYGFVPVDRPPGLWGGYAEYQYLAPDSLLVPVGPDLDSVTATLFNPLGAGIRWAVTVPETQPGDIVAVLGPGVRGLSACAAAKAAGAGFVMVTGKAFATRTASRAAAEFGADLAVDVAARGSGRRALRRVAGALADVVVDVTAKAPAASVRRCGWRAPAGPSCWPGRAARPTHPASSRTSSCTRSRGRGVLGVDAPATVTWWTCWWRALSVRRARPDRTPPTTRRCCWTRWPARATRPPSTPCSPLIEASAA